MMQKETMDRIIVRVYGLVINKNREILLSDEFVLETWMSKFPGGGLEQGEGTIECLKREFKEECMGQELENIRHYYTTDFYQKALYFEEAQLISVYYLVDLKHPVQFRISEKAFDFDTQDNIKQSFRWIKINELQEDDVTFPIDKFVVRKLKEEMNER